MTNPIFLFSRNKKSGNTSIWAHYGKKMTLIGIYETNLHCNEALCACKNVITGVELITGKRFLWNSVDFIEAYYADVDEPKLIVRPA